MSRNAVKGALPGIFLEWARNGPYSFEGSRVIVQITVTWKNVTKEEKKPVFSHAFGYLFSWVSVLAPLQSFSIQSLTLNRTKWKFKDNLVRFI